MKKIRFVGLLLLLLLLAAPSRAAEDWQGALAKTPAPTNSVKIHLTAPVWLLFDHFKPHGNVRGIVLMPGAADQLYYFERPRIFLPEKPTLLDVVKALTNHAEIKVTFAAPFILLHGKEDVVTDPLSIAAGAPEAILGKKSKNPQILYVDKAYDASMTGLENFFGLPMHPTRTDSKSWHFYRLAFTGFDLTGAEILRAMAYSMKTVATIDAEKITFKDHPRPTPK